MPNPNSDVPYLVALPWKFLCHPQIFPSRTSLIVVLLVTGAAVQVGLKCFPATCSNPLAVSWPWYVPLIFFLHAHIDVMNFTLSSKFVLPKGWHTPFIIILLCSFWISFFHLLLSSLFIASLHFITFTLPVWLNLQPRPAPTAAISMFFVSSSFSLHNWA